MVCTFIINNSITTIAIVFLSIVLSLFVSKKRVALSPLIKSITSKGGFLIIFSVGFLLLLLFILV